jgi:hypothetical protein
VIARPLLGVLTGLLAFAAAASELDVSAGKAFVEQRAAIEAELRTGDKYAEISSSDRGRVMTLFHGMAMLIEAAGSVEALHPPDQVALFNKQEELNRILTGAAKDSQLICKRERMTGSNFPVNQCRTVAQRRAEQEGGRDVMDRGVRAQERAMGR